MSKRDTPRHIGYIVDGNRRWARTHGLPEYEGHLAGYSTAQDIILATFEAGVEYVSCYIFSTENWKRSEGEVNKLLGLIFRPNESDIKNLMSKGIKVVILGSREGLSNKVIQQIEKIEARSAGNSKGTLALCFNYGGQLEIVDAFKKIIKTGVAVDDISAELVADNLYQPGMPSVDMIVRTGGEQRLSNFMLWRSAYSEFLFLEKYWPDMTKEDVTAILNEYSERNRRFGG